jgi:hypothetical protein
MNTHRFTSRDLARVFAKQGVARETSVHKNKPPRQEHLNQEHQNSTSLFGLHIETSLKGSHHDAT